MLRQQGSERLHIVARVRAPEGIDAPRPERDAARREESAWSRGQERHVHGHSGRFENGHSMLENGAIAMEGPRESLLANPHIRQAYLGL